jgi:sigma-B regulation protein RsbU (phosphoserine phosphatase)
MDKNINKLILSSKKRLESVFDSIADPILIIGRDFSIHRLNRAAARMIRMDFPSVLGKKCYEKFHSLKTRCASCPHAKVIKEKEMGSIRMRKGVGSEERIFDVRFFPLYDKRGHVGAVVEHYVDITAGEIAKMKLEASYRNIKTELQIARKIQDAQLPPRVPEIPGLDIEIHYQPVAEVGGDLYDFIHIDHNHWGILIADVSGHGIPAALINSMAKMCFYTHTPANLSARDVFEKVNHALFNNLMMEYYISGAYYIFDSLYNRMTFSRAGHPEAILVNQDTGEIREISAKGYFLGMMSNGGFEEKEIFLQKGDRLLLYTDGLSEISNAQREKFGIERLKQAMLAGRSRDIAFVKQKIIGEIKKFTGKVPLGDDMTFILIEISDPDCLERFKLGRHFNRERKTRLFRISHPIEFRTGISGVLTDLKVQWYPEEDIRNISLALYETLNMVFQTAKSKDDIFVAWQCTQEELRVVVVDKRFESHHKYVEAYKKRHQAALKIIKKHMTKVLFPDAGRKILLFKKNPNY